MNTIGNTLPRRFKAKASGAITAGKPLIVEADGDVAQVAQTSVGQTVGTPVVFESAFSASNEHASVFDSSNNKVVFTYSDYGNSGYGTAVVGTVSGTTISFGTPVVFASHSTGTDVAATFDTSNNKVVVAYRNSDASQGTAIVGTVSGTSISFGTAVVFENANSEYIVATFDTSSNKVVIAYTDKGNSNYGTAVVGTVSGTSISFGTPVVFKSGNTAYSVAVFDSTNNKIVIGYRDSGDSGRGKAVVGTVSGTAISFGSIATFETSEIKEYFSGTFDSNAGKVFFSYQQANDHRGIVGTVSGTSISFGSAADINSDESRDSSCTFDSHVNKVVVIYDDVNNSNYGTAVPVTISGTSFSVGTESVFESANVAYLSCCFDSNEKVVAIQYSDTGNSNYGTGVIYQNAGTRTTLTAENYIGIAEYAASNTETATVLIKGGVSTTQSSLTPGQTYFVQGDGTVGLTADTPSVTAGTAVTSTKLIVKG